MANPLKTPGVYIEEVPKFPPSVAAVQTAIPAFIGYTEQAKKNGKDLEKFTPTRISSEIEYRTIFGGPQPEENLKVAIEKQADNTKRYIVSFNTEEGKGASQHIMYYSLQQYFQNGGGPCYIISTGNYLPLGTLIGDITPYMDALEALKKKDEPTLIVFPEGQNIAKNSFDSYFQILETALAQCEKLKDRFVIMDLHHDGVGLTLSSDILDVIEAFRNKVGPIEALKFGAAYFPNILSAFNYQYDPTKVAVTGATQGTTMDALISVEKNAVKLAIENFPINLPPGSSVAGVYARVDSTRGVWKAPANESVNSVSDLTCEINDDLQGLMNVDETAGKSINAIRFFSGKGILIWGARTLDGNDNEWRYISVRRYFNMVEESTKKATEAFVFEPNDANTWIKVKAMIENFLILQWRDGALAGVKPEHAFYVSVGLNQTMTAQDILEGKMIIEIGLAVVRPAEFIILQFTHKMQES